MKFKKKALIIGATAAVLVVITAVVLVLTISRPDTPSTPDNTSTTNQTSEKSEEKEEKISVPQVKGLSESEAVTKLEVAGFKVRINSDFNTNTPKGKVVSQNKKNAVKGAEIVITVSLGPDLVTVPNTVGLTESEAVLKLKSAGFLVKTDIKCSSTIPEGKILSVSVAAGEQLPRGSEVKVLLSAGISNTYGTTPSNAIEYGRVAAQGDWVYFVNNKFGWEIYKMRHDGSEKQRVAEGTAFTLNVLGEWIYFTSDNGINRVKLNGTEKTRLSPSESQWIFVTEDYLYYLSGYNSGNIMRMTHDGKNPTVISKDTCRDVNFDNGRFYYTSGSTICSVKIDGTDKQVHLSSISGTHFKVNDGNCIISENIANTITTFTADGNNFNRARIPNHQMLCMNFYKNQLYFYEIEFFGYGQTPITRICKSNPDTSNKVVLLDNVNLPSTNNFLCVEADWVYYINPDDLSFLYRVKTDGTAHERVAY